MTHDNAAALFAASDMYQLLKRFTFRTEPETAHALVSGALASDAETILLGLGFSPEKAESLVEGLKEPSDGLSEDELFHAVRRDFTRLLANPKISVLVPYESAYLGKEGTLADEKSPLCSTVTNVKEAYRSAGFVSEIDTNERADHMGCELEFMQVLRKNQALTLESDRDEESAQIALTAEGFIDAHLKAWGVAFFEDVASNAATSAYRAIGAMGAEFLMLEATRANAGEQGSLS